MTSEDSVVGKENDAHSSPSAGNTPKPCRPCKPKLKQKSPRGKAKRNNETTEELSWRDGTSNYKSTTPPKSTGIPPKSFHSSGGNRVRLRKPGMDFVDQIHATSQENILREEKSQLLRQQEAKWSAFKKVTSLKRWPLQDLAMQDYNSLLEEYMNEDSYKIHQTNNSDNNGNQEAPEKEYGSSCSSNVSTDRKRVMQEKDSSPAKGQLRERFKNDFLLERRIAAHNVVTPDLDPAEKFDSGMWSMEPRIFSTEKAHGKRKYLVGHLGRLMDHIWKKTDRHSRHFYEMILEGTPCRLYFDLEYSIPENLGICNEKLLNDFYEELHHELQTQFPDHTNDFDRTCIVDLDSSTPQKFSRHWIVHLPSKALFKDTAQVGKFVKNFIQRLADGVATEMFKDERPQLQDYLFVNPKGTFDQNLPLSQKTCFCDLGVYTKNRLFRLLGSSKFGKSPDCALRLADANQFPFPNGFSNAMFYGPAMVKSEPETGDNSSGTKDDETTSAVKKLKELTDWSLHAQVLCSTLVVPMNFKKIDYPLLPQITDEALGREGKTIKEHLKEASNNTTASQPCNMVSYSIGLGESPYPYIDEFILNELANRGGIQGSIRSWTLDYGQQKSDIPVGISYSMSRNRWCENIQRSHKSNNILWNVDFHKRMCVQSCFDPDCRATKFRGKPVDLPFDVCQKLEDSLFEAQIAHMDEKELIGGKAENKIDFKQEADDKNFGFTRVDDEEFERAMMALNLDGDDNATEQAGKKKCVPDKKRESLEGSLSDEALLDAMLANPDLFN